ncbi:MAG: hypothetical protein IJX16_01610 [Clostridia bacterium]|nr:hypothetical protein [Clostridia bacterium]
MKKTGEKNKYEIVDFFAQIAGGNKRLETRIPALKHIPPLEIKHVEMPSTNLQDVKFVEFDEKAEYENFLKEKEELKNHYRPFLQNYSREINTPRIETTLVDFLYRKETDQDKEDFSIVLTGKGEWEKIKLPHYVGPTGIWNAFYKTEINLDEKQDDLEYLIDFEAVDYIAEVYLNGRLVAHHTGFFAPFTAILTPYIRKGRNSLVVVVKNDVIVTGDEFNGGYHYGNKIYGQTHLGYDEPELGWHHNPAGAGIFGKVKFITCKKQRITEIFVRPDIDSGKINVETTVYNFLHSHAECEIRYTVEGRNFKQVVFENYQGKIKKVQIEENYLEENFDIPNFKLWTINEPYLYQITVTLTDKQGNIIDEKQTHFGMRKFHMDENSTPKGKFYFNNERIILRGANEMGHLPRCVMENNYEQLIDDIMIAKVAGLNFFRLTQRPVLGDIYTYFDMLGMLCQTDFPCFLFLRESVVGEAFKEVVEMEHHTRNHPSVVIESFCNEIADSWDYCWEQYGLGRVKMQNFFDGARQAVLMCNPDRVVKYCDGEYSQIGESYGVSDFHCYTYWYVNHGVDSGKFEKGYLPPFRPEWMTGCGEYGSDGLDRLEIMEKYFPKDWLPNSYDEPWTPKRIAKAQCFGSHGQFFPEQRYIKDWIRESREWQRKALKLFVHGLRRRIDYVQSCAVHLLIDAWPSGWTKTLVDVDRMPKPAYYSFKEANIPVRLSMRNGQRTAYNDDALATEFYALNDTNKTEKAHVRASVYYGDKLINTYEKEFDVEPLSSTYVGDVVITPKDFIGKIKVVGEMFVGEQRTQDMCEYYVLPRNEKASCTPLIFGEKLQGIKSLCQGNTNENIIFCEHDYYRENQDEIEKKITDGARAVVFTVRPINVFDENIIFKVHNLPEELGTTKSLVWHNDSNEFVKEFSEMAFNNLYNADGDYQELFAWHHFDWEGSEEILYDMIDESSDKYVLNKKHKMVMARKKYGKGELVLTTLNGLKGCIGHNPHYDKLFINLIEK